MRIVDLFSGIGGFSLSATWVWGDSLDIACFCERDEFCQKVLRKHWPNVPIVGDIYDLERIVGHTEGHPSDTKCEVQNGEKPISRGSNGAIDLITAGFPCQPASTAGCRKGTEDDRWLWPPLLAAIRELKPRWLLLENVPGLLSLESGVVFEHCCTDLEAQGYEVQPLLIPACGVGAPHKRERLWIVGYSTQQLQHRTRSTGQRWGNEYPNSDCHAAHTNQPRPQIRKMQPGNGRTQQQTIIRNPWHEHWYEAATRLCTVDDGLPGRLVRPGWRVNALKAAGNSIVPQVAARIMMAIKEVD